MLLLPQRGLFSRRLTLALGLSVCSILCLLTLGFLPPRGVSANGTHMDWHVVAGGELMFVRPGNFGLAVHRDQVLVKAVIPPCDESFDYCLYYFGDEFAGTNFQSAGVRIERRRDLETPEACLYTPPRGYVEFQPTVRRGEGFAVSLFAPLFDGAAGSYAEGRLYRLFLDGTSSGVSVGPGYGTESEAAAMTADGAVGETANETTHETEHEPATEAADKTVDVTSDEAAAGQTNTAPSRATCFEVESRIGLSQHANFPEGTIRELTGELRDSLEAQLRDVLRAVRWVDRPDVILFEVP